MARGAPVAAGEAVAPERFAAALRELGYDFFTGVPCSFVSGLMLQLDRDPEVPYYPETREDSAVGLACGAMMAGKRPVIVMQNSGLGVSINGLLALALMYRVPLLLLITWRGYGGTDAPDHNMMGAVCDRLLDTVGIPYRVPEPETLLEDLRWATEMQREQRTPAALLLRQGVTR